MDIFKLLQTLTETPAPSGYEQQMADVLTELWQPLTETLTRDRVGNLIAVKRGHGSAPRPRLLLAAHMDEIALMVKNIAAQGENGFLRVTGVGGIDLRHLYGQLVVVHGKRSLTGVLGGLPVHLLKPEQQDQPHGYDDLLIDLGLPLAEVQTLVSVGDFVSFYQPLRKLQGKLVTGKALDNRASLAAVTVCLEYLHGRTHTWDVVAVATCQEETRLLGAYTSAYAQQPDAAVAIDVTFGKSPGVNGGNTFDLGGGPVLDLGPNVHPGMYQALLDTAEALEMKVEIGTHNRASGTDAYGLQIARAGIPTGLVSIPLRYMHTMVEVVDLTDVERCGRLLGEFIAHLDDKFLTQLTTHLMEAETGK